MSSRLVTQLSRLFGGGGKVPDEYAELVADPATLLSVTKASMTGHVAHLHAPNRTASKSVTWHSGLVVIQPELLVVKCRRLRLHATYSGDPAAPVRLSFAPDGIKVTLDVDRALPNSRGELSIEVKLSIPSQVLAQLPARELRASAPEPDYLTVTRWA